MYYEFLKDYPSESVVRNIKGNFFVAMVRDGFGKNRPRGYVLPKGTGISSLTSLGVVFEVRQFRMEQLAQNWKPIREQELAEELDSGTYKYPRKGRVIDYDEIQEAKKKEEESKLSDEDRAAREDKAAAFLSAIDDIAFEQEEKDVSGVVSKKGHGAYDIANANIGDRVVVYYEKDDLEDQVRLDHIVCVIVALTENEIRCSTAEDQNWSWNRKITGENTVDSGRGVVYFHEPRQEDLDLFEKALSEKEQQEAEEDEEV